MYRPLIALRHIAVLLLLVMTTSIFAQVQPEPLPADTPVSGTLDGDNLADIYTFQGLADSIVSFTASSDDFAAGVLLTDGRGTLLAEGAADDEGFVSIAGIELAATDEYLVTVFTAPGSAGSYELTLTVEGVETVEPEATAVVESEIVTSLPPANDVLLNNGMEVRLQWSGAVDLNLEVRDPLGNSLFFDRRTSPIGGSFGFDANGLCDVISEAPVETATWQPGFLPSGSYEVLIFYRQSCEETASPEPFTLTVTVNGQVLETVSGTIQPPPTGSIDSVYLANFIVVDETTATINQGGAYPDTAINQLPAPAPALLEQANPISIGQPIQGAIFEDQDYVVYSFEGSANQVVSINMTATSRNLDTLVQLVNPDGTLLRANDDANNSTNSALQGVPLVQDGTYLVIAARYGKEFGGTEGNYQLVVSESVSSLPAELANLGLPDGAIEVYLTWNNNTDLQLLVRDPVGQAVYDDNPTVNSGGVLAANGNVACQISEGDPVSYIYWPPGVLRPGVYEIDVWFENNCNDTSIPQFTLTVVVDGQVVLVEERSPTIGSNFITTFEVFADGTAQAGLSGFAETGVTLDLLQNEERLPIQFNVPVQGAITRENAIDVYAFDGSAGQIVTISMERSGGGTLDTKVFLLSESGVTLADNDDADAALVTGVQGRTTDSLISGFVLPADGQYLIVATRYATIFGGTTGAYQLTVQLNQ